MPPPIGLREPELRGDHHGEYQAVGESRRDDRADEGMAEVLSELPVAQIPVRVVRHELLDDADEDCEADIDHAERDDLVVSQPETVVGQGERAHD